MKAKFILRGNTIHIRNKVKGIVFGYSTGIRIMDNWELNNNRIIPNNADTLKINQELMDIENVYERCYMELGSSLTHYKFKELFLKSIAGYTSSTDNVKELAEQFEQGIEKGTILSTQNKLYSKDSIRAMKTSLKIVQQFSANMVLADISKSTGEAFQHYLNKKKKDCSINTIRKHIKVLKTFGQWLYSNNHLEYNFSREWKKPSEPELTHTWLTTEEIQSIIDCPDISDEYTGHKFLMIIQAHTGLRVSDLLSLRQHHVKDLTIQLKMKKTKTNVVIPVAKKVIMWFYNYFNTDIYKKLTEQEYNLAIKHICFVAGIDEPTEQITLTSRGEIKTIIPKWKTITSHSLRRSCLTNLYLKGTPRKFIMSISGHKTEASLNKYLLQSNIQLMADFDINEYQ